MHALTETMEIKVRCFVCKYLELRCACVCMRLRESQFQVFVMNPNKSCLLPDPVVIQHGRQIKKKKGQLGAAVLHAWPTFI